MASRYLVIAPQGLGDSLEATPLVAALRMAEKDAIVDVLVLRKQAQELFGGLENLVSETIYLPYWELGPTAFVKSILQQRRRTKYDVSFLCYPAARAEYQVLSAAFPSRRRVAHKYYTPSLRSMMWLSTDLVDIKPVHNVLRNMDLLSAVGIPWSKPEAYVAPANWFNEGNIRNPKMVALHIGSIAHDGLESRRWPVGMFASLATHLCERGYTVQAIMGPSEVRETNELRALEPRVGVIEGSLAGVARFLSQCALTIANDNGIAHLSAAMRTPTISLFGPTPLEHAPYGPESFPIRPSACPPCFDVRLLNTDCALNIDFKCIRQDISPNAVAARALAILENIGMATAHARIDRPSDTMIAPSRQTPG